MVVVERSMEVMEDPIHVRINLGESKLSLDSGCLGLTCLNMIGCNFWLAENARDQRAHLVVDNSLHAEMLSLPGIVRLCHRAKNLLRVQRQPASSAGVSTTVAPLRRAQQATCARRG